VRSGKVLVLGSDTRAFLATVRSLGRRGLEVHTAWCPPSRPAARSRFIAHRHDVPSYASHDDAWLEVLRVLLAGERFDLVIPCEDPVILPLQRHRSDLERYAPLSLLDDEAFAVTSSKPRTDALARSLGIPVADGRTVTTSGGNADLIRELGLPLVLKPATSYALDDLDGKRHVRAASTPQQLRDGLDALLSHGPVLVQEHFRGRGVGVELLVHEGHVLFAFQHVRLHERVKGGGSSYRMSVPLDSEMLDACGRLMGALDYTGVAMVEFRRDPRSGRWILIEINGRLWGSLPLAVAAGADFPFYLYQMLVEGRREFPASYRKGICARNWLRDAVWLWHNLHADRADPTLCTEPWWRIAAEPKHFVTFRERSDTLVHDDPGPAVAEVSQGVCLVARRLLTRRRVANGATP
jgi:predicted ATP-grasp superfamily ATP-dependent carboligase